MAAKRYGHVPGVPVGKIFADRRALHDAGLHGPLQSGISGSSTEAADSIVLSGGYEDDRDNGDEIVYTGQGGNDPVTKKQIADQRLERGNQGLVLSMAQELPVRVIRGSRHSSPISPSYGYRYDGLYQVVDCWPEKGKSGFVIFRYRLKRIKDS